MSTEEYGIHLARQRSALTTEQVEQAARLLVQVEHSCAA